MNYTNSQFIDDLQENILREIANISKMSFRTVVNHFVRKSAVIVRRYLYKFFSTTVIFKFKFKYFTDILFLVFNYLHFLGHTGPSV